MEQWDQSFVDAEVQGYFEFEPNNVGGFQFGYVSGYLDSEETTRDGKHCIEFSWGGNDECDPVQGRGWALLEGKEIAGKICIHQGDRSAFRARKSK